MPPRRTAAKRREVHIVPRNPADFREGDMESLAATLDDAMPRSYAMIVGAPPGKPPGVRGVTWYEIITIWTTIEPYAKGIVGQAASRALRELGSAFVRWVRAKRKKRRENRRPTFALIYGPREEILLAILVDSDGKVHDQTADEIRSRQQFARAAQDAATAKTRDVPRAKRPGPRGRSAR